MKALCTLLSNALILVLFASIASAQFISIDGLRGYYATPSATIYPQGYITLFANNLPVYYSPSPDITNSAYSSGFNLSLFDNFEMGTVFSAITTDANTLYTTRLATKYQFKQFSPNSPLLSVGFTDMLNSQNYIGNPYFVSSIEFSPMSAKMSIETGALYQNYTPLNSDKYTPIRAFLNLGIDYQSVGFFFENRLSNLGFELSQFLIFRPWTIQSATDKSELSIMIGHASADTYSPKAHSFVTSIQYSQNLNSKNPDIERVKKRHGFYEPIVWITVNPVTQLLYENDFYYRAGLKTDIALETGLRNLLWVHSFNTIIAESKSSPIEHSLFWSKNALQYQMNRRHTGEYFSFKEPRLLFGSIEYSARGLLWNQRFSFLTWRESEHTLGLINHYAENKNRFLLYSIATLPIHKPLTGALRSTQAYIEGGTYKDSDHGASLLIRHTFSKTLLSELSATFYQEKGISLALTLSGDFSKSIQKTWRLIHASISPQTRIKSDYSIDHSSVSVNTNTKISDYYFEKSSVHANDHLDSSYYNSIIFCKDSVVPSCEVTDADSDGIADHRDACPLDPEDLDTYLDGDGCPDTDNDNDSISDSFDQCPNAAEDYDGFENQDGCPELDNDGDAIPDSLDACIFQKEDIDGFEDTDGCPDLDNDKDGIPDNLDRCVKEPEDIDGIDDTDGCPDYTDDDNIPEIIDNCPELTEDFDGFEDEDGCPELDNDGDGIIDIKDSCPNAYENFNNFNDEDGCPE